MYTTFELDLELLQNLYVYLYHSARADEKYRHSIYPPYTLAVSFDLSIHPRVYGCRATLS